MGDYACSLASTEVGYSMEILVMTVRKSNAIYHDEHPCQAKKNAKNPVRAQEENSALWSQVSEPLRSPDTSRAMGQESNKNSKRHGDGTH